MAAGGRECLLLGCATLLGSMCKTYLLDFVFSFTLSPLCDLCLLLPLQALHVVQSHERLIVSAGMDASEHEPMCACAGAHMTTEDRFGASI